MTLVFTNTRIEPAISLNSGMHMLRLSPFYCVVCVCSAQLLVFHHLLVRYLFPALSAVCFCVSVAPLSCLSVSVMLIPECCLSVWSVCS